MIRSLLIKLAMLAATVALVLWIGWPTQGLDLEPDETTPDSSPQTSQTSTPGPVSARKPAPPPLIAPDTKRVAPRAIHGATMEELEHLPRIADALARRVSDRRTA